MLHKTDKLFKKAFFHQGGSAPKIQLMDSHFSSQVFRNINFGDAKLYSCIFENMVFVDCNFGKTVLEYARIVGSKFIKGSEAVKYFERLFIEAIGICFAAIMVLTYGVKGNE